MKRNAPIVVLWSLVALLLLVSSVYIHFAVNQARLNHEGVLRSGLETYLATKVEAVEQSFQNSLSYGYGSEQFKQYILDYVVPLSSNSSASRYELESIMLSMNQLKSECRIWSPNAQVGAAIVPCENEVISETLLNNSYFNEARELPRSKRPAMYLTQLLSLPEGPNFRNMQFMILADWPRDVLDAERDSDVRTLRLQQAITALVLLALGAVLHRVLQRSDYLKLLVENTFEHLPDGIVVADEKGKILVTNPAMEKLSGRKLIGSYIEDMMPDRYIADHNKGMAHVAAGGDPSVLNAADRPILHMLHKSGSETPIRLVPNRFYAGGDQIFIASVADMTRQVQQMDEIAEQKARIERKSGQLSTLAKTSRHDVQNHLTVAETCLQFVQAEGYEAETVDLALTEIQNAIELGHSLSDWGRLIESDDGNLPVEPVNMNNLVNKAKVQGLTVKTHNLGKIDCNAGLMQSVVRNLMENAQKYAKDNPRMEVWRDEDNLHFKDWSGGFGVVDGKYDHEFAERLTMPNQRGDTEIAGTGLGLSNIKASIGAHGFKFRWITNEESGTTEWIIETK